MWIIKAQNIFSKDCYKKPEIYTQDFWTSTPSLSLSLTCLFIYKLSLPPCEVRPIPRGNHSIYQVQISYQEQTKRLTLLTEGGLVIKIISTKINDS